MAGSDDQDTIISTPEIIVQRVHYVGGRIALVAIRKLERLQKALRPTVFPFTSFRLYHVEKYDIAHIRGQKGMYTIDYWINILGSRAFGFGKKPLVGIQIKLTVQGMVNDVKIGMHYNRDLFNVTYFTHDQLGKERKNYNLISKALGSFEAIPERIESGLNKSLRKGLIDAKFTIAPGEDSGYFTLMPYEGTLA